jgi:hypothetical protein
VSELSLSRRVRDVGVSCVGGARVLAELSAAELLNSP